MKTIFIALTVIFAFSSFSQNKNLMNIRKGFWNAHLKITSTNNLAFTIHVKDNRISIINAEEEIILDELAFVNDSLRAHFPYFNSELVFVSTKKELVGYFQNYNRGKNYRIPFYAKRGTKSRFTFIQKKCKSPFINGKWEATFDPNTASAYPALGVFKQENKKSSVSGTFLTETGDYRFLEGNSTKDSVYLSCFDGSHAFLFTGKLIGDSLKGSFYSGNHWKGEWNAVRNENFKLESPEVLTYVKNNEPVEFVLPKLDSSRFSFPNDDYKGKVTIIQIMGTWCPNCLDESVFYKELYDKYHSKGLEIIAVCYEAGKDFNDYSRNAARLKNRLGLDYQFVIGGSASKNDASLDFSMLNDIISFPTSIYIDRNGEVKRVHTGFNGPGTGEYYDNYKKKTIALIESLLIR